MSDGKPETAPLSGRLLHGAGLMVAMRWLMRILGLVNIAILARLLSPEDFGIVAMAMVAVGIADGMFNVGIDRVVLQRGHGDHRYYSTAWTMRLCQGTLIALLLVILAPLAAHFYEDGRIQTILLLVALGTAIRGFESIGVTILRQQLRFSREFAFNVGIQLLSVPTTILLAFQLRSYLALALGMLLRDVIQTALSYAVAPYKATPTLSAWRELWSISQWNLFLNLVGAIHSRVPAFVLGKVATPDAVGRFAIAGELALTPTSEIAAPIARAFFPGFVKLRNETERFRAALLAAFEAMTMIGAAVCLGLAVVANELVLLALGAKWQDVVPLVVLYAIAAFFRIPEIFLIEQLFVFARVKRIAAVFVGGMLAIAIGTLPAYRAGGLEGVILLYIAIQATATSTFMVMVSGVTQVPLLRLIRCVVRPTVAGLAMVAAVVAIDRVTSLPLVPLLALKIGVGGTVFIAVAYIGWRLEGSPPGLETKVLEMLGKLRRRLPGRT